MIKNFWFKDFIGYFETEYDTQPLIDYWKYQDKCGATFRRYGIFGKDRKAHQRKDKCLATEDFMLDHNCGYEYMRQYNEITGACVLHYINEYEAVIHYRYQQVYLNVQRTKPSEGFHAFHCETGSLGTNRRVLATMMFLNDDFEGGETEFLYQNERVKAKRGMMLLWPAGFTHTHRGNPVLSGEKYISTSWLENVNA